MASASVAMVEFTVVENPPPPPRQREMVGLKKCNQSPTVAHLRHIMYAYIFLISPSDNMSYMFHSDTN